MTWVNGITMGIVLVLIGFYGVMTRKNLIKIVLCINIVFLGIILFFVSIGYVEDGIAPILKESQPVLYVDPLPQTLMLTTVVVELSTTALALALIIKVYEKYKTLHVRELQ